MLWEDLRFGTRLVRKDVRFSGLVILTLALAIGATTAIFSVVNAVLLRRPPFPDSERLAVVWKSNPAQGYPIYYMSPPDFLDFRNQNHVFERMAAFMPQQFVLTGRGEATQLNGDSISPSLFALLDVRAYMGRVFSDSDENPGHDHVALLSYSFWQRRLGSDPHVIGKSVVLDAAPYVVVGVMPRGFDYPPVFNLQGGYYPASPEVWVPLNLKSSKLAGIDTANRGAMILEVLGKLRPDISLPASQSDLDTINARLEQEYPETNKSWGVRIVSLQTQFTGNVRPSLVILMGAVGMVLLIGCANAANLLLARSVTRQREVAIRLAMGASRLRLIRQLLTESVLMAVAGAALGLAFAYGANRLLIGLSPATIPHIGESSVDARVLAFTLLVAILTGVVFGLAPALQSTAQKLSEALKEGGRGSAGGFERLRLRNILVIAEIAVSFMLLIGAGLLLRSFARLRAVNPGFDTQNLLTVWIQLSATRYPQPAARRLFFKQVLDRVAALPGVQSAAAIDAPPWSGAVGSYTFEIEGRPPVAAAERPIASPHVVSPNFFQTAEIPLLKGRTFTGADSDQRPGVVLINEAMARRFFPDEDPIGKRINFLDPPAAPMWLSIIGVVGDVHYDALSEEPGADVYASYLQPYPVLASSYMTLILRGSNPTSLVSAVRHQVATVDPDQPIGAVKTMDEYLDSSISRQRLSMVLLGVFAGLALVLAVLGIYGVISYSVGQRTREIGVRMALGAEPRDVIRLILTQGTRLAVLGAIIGLGFGFGFARLMSGLLYGVSSSDPATYAVVALVLIAAALLAAYLPARSATRIAPTAALRHE
ncbi:MAG TPA: ABC transporter permease [Terriglobia bacterium]|nr:ABC transporter permease [Terriglobia bacterium]